MDPGPPPDSVFRHRPAPFPPSQQGQAWGPGAFPGAMGRGQAGPLDYPYPQAQGPPPLQPDFGYQGPRNPQYQGQYPAQYGPQYPQHPGPPYPPPYPPAPAPATPPPTTTTTSRSSTGRSSARNLATTTTTTASPEER